VSREDKPEWLSNPPVSGSECHSLLVSPTGVVLEVLDEAFGELARVDPETVENAPGRSLSSRPSLHAGV
jgi:hypothetical protein